MATMVVTEREGCPRAGIVGYLFGYDVTVHIAFSSRKTYPSLRYGLFRAQYNAGQARTDKTMETQ